MTRIQAVYENGVLRPKEPLSLAEGEEVQVSVYPRLRITPLRPPTPEEEDYTRRLNATRTIEEMHAVMATAPPWEEEYDIVKALNDNRRASGERLLFPESEEGGTP